MNECADTPACKSLSALRHASKARAGESRQMDGRSRAGFMVFAGAAWVIKPTFRMGAAYQQARWFFNRLGGRGHCLKIFFFFEIRLYN